MSWARQVATVLVFWTVVVVAWAVGITAVLVAIELFDQLVLSGAAP